MPWSAFSQMPIHCNCESQWEINSRCPVHGYVKPETADYELEERFLKTEPRHVKRKDVPASQTVELRRIFEGIIERASIGRSVAILEDEEENFHIILRLAREGIRKL